MMTKENVDAIKPVLLNMNFEKAALLLYDKIGTTQPHFTIRTKKLFLNLKGEKGIKDNAAFSFHFIREGNGEYRLDNLSMVLTRHRANEGPLLGVVHAKMPRRGNGPTEAQMYAEGVSEVKKQQQQYEKRDRGIKNLFKPNAPRTFKKNRGR